MNRTRALRMAAATGTIAVAAWLAPVVGAGAPTSAAYAQQPCVSSAGTPATVSYTVEPVGDTPPFFHVTALHVSGLPDGCAGAAVEVQLWGDSGDSSLPVTSGSLLSTANSAVDPCSQKALAHPPVVQSGTIDLALCATGGPAGYPSVHDLTRVSVAVNGFPLTASLGGSRSEESTGGIGASGGTGTHSGLLAFTGSNLGLAVWLGLFTVVGGLLILLWEWRGRRRTRAELRPE